MRRLASFSRSRREGLAADSRGNRVSPLFLLAVAIAAPVLFVLAASLMYHIVYDGRIYPGVSAGGIDLSGYRPDEARAVLVARFQRYADAPLAVRYNQQEWQQTPAQMGMRFDVDATVTSAYAIGRSGSFFQQVFDQLDAWRHGEAAQKPVFRLDPQQRSSFFAQLSQNTDVPPVNARLTISTADLRTVLSPSQQGHTVNVDKTAQRIEAAIATQSTAPIDLVVDDQTPTVVEADLVQTQALADKMMSSPLVTQFQGQTWKIERPDIAGLLTLREQVGSPKVVVDIADQPLQRLVDRMAKAINRSPFNARFDYTGGQFKVIRDAIDGLTLDVPGTIAAIKSQLGGDNRTLNIPVNVTKPAIGSGDSNKLNIAGIIAQDSTSYAGSIPERAYNLELAASRLHGVVVAPGETFSFNDEVGPVNTLSGYKVGYGITQQGGNAVTVPSVGGGICQVATTLFHPAFWAGYDIGDRYAHLYWIPNYGIPPMGMKGLDTTIDQIYDNDGNLVYALDFTFKNNSPNPILIQSKTDGNKVTFTLLGTKPTWQVKVDPVVVDNVVPAIQETERQEDPAMAAGRTIILEEARDGFRATIVRTVTQDGKVIDKHTFVSNYVATKNVILVGTKKDPNAPAATPSTTPTTTPSPTPAPAKPSTTPAPSTPTPSTPTSPTPIPPALKTPTPTPTKP